MNCTSAVGEGDPPRSRLLFPLTGQTLQRLDAWMSQQDDGNSAHNDEPHAGIVQRGKDRLEECHTPTTAGPFGR